MKLSLLQNTKTAIWFNRLIRWSLGVLFITAGAVYFKDGGWPAIFFGSVIFITGFFRPRRCMNE